MLYGGLILYYHNFGRNKRIITIRIPIEGKGIVLVVGARGWTSESAYL